MLCAEECKERGPFSDIFWTPPHSIVKFDGHFGLPFAPFEAIKKPKSRRLRGLQPLDT